MLLVTLLIGSLAGLGGLFALRKGSEVIDPPAPEKAAAYRPDQVAADGVVEGARPEVAIRPDVAGTLGTVSVRVGQDVSRGALLAELENEIRKQTVALAAGELAKARAQFARLRNGERAEKRKAAAAFAQAKAAIYLQAKAEWERSRKLNENHSTSQEQYDRDYFAMLKAQAEWEQAVAERTLLEAPARADEIAIEKGNVAAAEARLRVAEAELAKTRLLAPTDGRILQVFAEPGEQAGPATAQPVLLIADLSKRRVRAFVEELDAVRVRVGQRAEVTADGLPGRSFAGTVAMVLPRMGHRGPHSDAPGEYKDLYFRETLIDLDAGDELPINFRVQVRIEMANPQEGRDARR
ncbi:MAG: efflux RND transporter periplasmic adaptor subunit [Singulisphaera sp.]|nr:efflux RND transporter periplasmic adaptor subunit [Singulisphaera sp.]